MEPEHRPVSTSTFPWTRTGLAVGALFAFVFALIDDDAGEVAPTSTRVASAATAAPAESARPDAEGARASFDPVDVPWPPGARTSTMGSRAAGRVEAGDSVLSVAAAERFFEDALASCAPTRMSVGESVSLVCENARDESRAVIVARGEGTWLRTSRLTFSAPMTPAAGAVPSEGDVGDATCGAPLRYVALPAGARVSLGGGGLDGGHCTFDVDGRPAIAWATMLHNVFRAGTAVQRRQLDDGAITRWTAEGWDDGWWRVDVVSASGSEERARVTLQRWAPGEIAWVSPASLDEKLAALASCWEPCALALRGPARSIDTELVERCLFECRGVERAPAVRALVTPSTSAASAR